MPPGLLTMPTPVHRYRRNRTGGDFVVGDIHGEFAGLEARLDDTGFDPGRDRLFSVGDLIDRGPDSRAALEWLARPWFHAVMGNHEEMLISACQDEAELLWWFTNGGTWWLDDDEESRHHFLAALQDLPIAIEVETGQGLVGIVHADVPAGYSWPRFVRRLEKGDPRVRDQALWSRSRAYNRNRRAVRGIHEVFCGHTPLSEPRIVGNVHLIDTGACFDGYLTVVPISGTTQTMKGRNMDGATTARKGW